MPTAGLGNSSCNGYPCVALHSIVTEVAEEEHQELSPGSYLLLLGSHTHHLHSHFIDQN